ncbi:WD40-repeat-containing domain protein [Parasitella parasitica]|nr:WD40-repeat-containing domain protein [Parasitella parasitica]
MSSSITKFDTGHEDLIHDISYDFYGKRLVTCSSDQRLKVWDFVERSDASVWELNDAWKAHDSSIHKAIWARPEYGQIIASCSFDRQVKIWEEQTVEPRNSQKRWAERFRLVDARGAVLDIAFAPSQDSLRLATCSSDGIVRIYEALEPTDLAQWSQMEEFEISSAYYQNSDSKFQSGISQIHQQQQQQQQQLQQNQLQLTQQQPQISQNGFYQTQNAHNAYQQHSQTPMGYPYMSTNQLPQHPFGQQPVHTNSTSSSGSSIAGHGLSTPGVSDIPTMTSTVQGVSPGSATGIAGVSAAVASNVHRPIIADSGYCIDWCPNRTPSAMIAVGLGKEIGARIFKHDGHNRWIPSEFLPGHTQEVHDISWAPSMARSYQLIATASKDNLVRIYKLTEQQQQQQQQQQQSQTQPQQQQQRGRVPNSPAGTPTQAGAANRSYHIELIASFNDHKAEVWKVEWNITGTILSSSGDDGKLRLWTAGYDGKWRQMAAITANTQVHS